VNFVVCLYKSLAFARKLRSFGFFSLLHALFVQYERSLSIVLARVGLMALGEMGEVDVMMILEVIVVDLFFSVQKSLGVVERRGSAELSAGPLL